MQWLLVDAARKESSVGASAEIRGWIRTRRDSKGGFSFLEVNDGSCFGNLQVVAPSELDNYEAEIKKLAAGCSVVITGEIKASPAAGQATECRSVGFGFQLPADGQESGPIKEVVGIIDRAARLGQTFEIQSRDPEHFPGTLAIAGGDDRRLDITE